MSSPKAAVIRSRFFEIGDDKLGPVVACSTSGSASTFETKHPFYLE